MKPEAVVELERAPQKVRRRLIARIRKLAAGPVLEGSEWLSGGGKYRLRYEDYRVVYWVDYESMRVVVAVLARRQPQTEIQ